MSSQLPIIFLDFDGVLNNTVHAFNAKGKDWQNQELDRDCIERLNNLIKETGAKVVVTSTWRLNRTVEELQSILNKYGFEGQVIGKTPSYRHLDGVRVLRGNEILHWISENENIIGAKYYDYKRYVILDDDSDMLYWQKDNFICVDAYCGITPKTIFMAKKILLDKNNVLN